MSTTMFFERIKTEPEFRNDFLKDPRELLEKIGLHIEEKVSFDHDGELLCISTMGCKAQKKNAHT